MFWGAVALFVLVAVLLAVSLMRPALLAGIRPVHWVIGGGLVLPIPILAVLLVVALVLGEELLPKLDSGAPMRVEVRAAQWRWQFSYPDAAGAPTTDVLHLPAGEPVDLVVTSQDVIHSFWIPRLGGKIDAIPGHVNVIRLMAGEPGIYHGTCSEYCGRGHDVMQLRAEAHEPDAFAAALGGAP